jgi:hypothetical protein
MCPIVQRVWIGEWPNKKTKYLVLRNGQRACIRLADHLECSKATQLPEPSQLSQSVPRIPQVDRVCGKWAHNEKPLTSIERAALVYLRQLGRVADCD